MNSSDNDCEILRSKSKHKKGVIYLSALPKFMNVTKIRDIMSNFGQVGRVYLQPRASRNKTKPSKHFSEGWVEFEKKIVAKQVASGLNNKKIECKKKSQLYDFIWNVKYLSKFKWIHLTERVAYERASKNHRKRIELSRAKKETNHFSTQVDRNWKSKSTTSSSPNHEVNKKPNVNNVPFPQKKIEAEFKKSKSSINNTDIMNILFK